MTSPKEVAPPGSRWSENDNAVNASISRLALAIEANSNIFVGMTARYRRVATLLPAATEIVGALGADELLVGISHECDYPTHLLDRPRLTWSPIDPNWPSA